MNILRIKLVNSQEFLEINPELLISLVYLFDGTCRTSTRLLFPSLSCHSVEVQDSVPGQNSVRCTWRPFSMYW
jgi:hypothetical protein